jgi:2-amino-4-hydroxy-6-hydroxymethyldihydropteridine diphosphokinase
MTRALLSLGSNLGDRLAHLRAAMAGLDETVIAVSGVYETAPWPPGEDVPEYLNAAVLAVDPDPDPYRWLARARELERAAGRVRRSLRAEPTSRRRRLRAGLESLREPGDRYAPRSLDVDVIMVWDDADQPVISDDPELTLPHPRAHLRGFVLRPWVDIQPYAQLPGHGWLTDLLRSDPVAEQLATIRSRPDLAIES